MATSDRIFNKHVVDGKATSWQAFMADVKAESTKHFKADVLDVYEFADGSTMLLHPDDEKEFSHAP